MAEINGRDRYFGYRTLETQGKCCICEKKIPKDSEKVIRIRAGRSCASICKDCCEIISNVSFGNTYGYKESDFNNYL